MYSVQSHHSVALIFLALCLVASALSAPNISPEALQPDVGIRRRNASTTNPSTEHARVCVKYTESGPDDIQGTVKWLEEWIAKGDNNRDDYSPGTRNGGYLPATLQEYFAIPKEAFDCPGPVETQGNTTACIVPTKDYCFSGHGCEADLISAWAVLTLIARFRIARLFVELMYVYTVTPPKGDQYGKGLAKDFASIVKDFYNGAHGDSQLPSSEIVQLVASIFLFTPYGIRKSQVIFRENYYNLNAIQNPSNKAFNCSFGDLMKATDCLTTGGFSMMHKKWSESSVEVDKSQHYIEVIDDMAKLTVPPIGSARLFSSQYKAYREYFMRATFMQIQKAQDLFVHVQPYDKDPAPGQESAYKPFWGIFCSAIVTSMAGYWCKDKPDAQSRAYYPVQIAARKNNTIRFDYPAWDMVNDYGWNGTVIMGQSHRCADLRSQSFDMKDVYPNIFSAISQYKSAVSWFDGLDTNNIDYTDCLWSLPILEFSDGPNFSGMDKIGDTFTAAAMELNSISPTINSDRNQWKEDSGRSEQVWRVVRDSDYCPGFGILGDIIGGPTVTLLSFSKDFLGLGEVASDDQVVADVFGTQQLIRPSTPAADALQKIHDTVCKKQTNDSFAEIAKEIIDNMLNIAVFTVTEGGPFLISLVLQSTSAAMASTIVDDFFLQPFVDNVLKQQFIMDGEAEDEVQNYLIPLYDTSKVGDGEGGVKTQN